MAAPSPEHADTLVGSLRCASAGGRLLRVRGAVGHRGPALLLAAASALTAGCGGGGGSGQALPNHAQVLSLYVIDHNGAQPRSDAALAPYSAPFEKILGGCKTNPNDLTNLAIQLAEKASDAGARTVTNLEMLRAIALRIVWPPSKPHGCGYIFNLEEAHMETGVP